ncbi:hypothetical protein EV182_002619, partial [Spiromyces aspiralis]
EAEDLIIDYLKKVNRPYSASDVSSNLHNQVSKVNAQKILISLAESGVDNIDVPSVEEAEEVEEQIKELSEEVAALKSENGAMQAKLNALNSSLTNEQITKRIEELKDKASIPCLCATPRNAANTAKLQVLRSGEVISEEEKQRIVNYHEEMVKLYKKRKRMARFYPSLVVMSAVHTWPSLMF